MLRVLNDSTIQQFNINNLQKKEKEKKEDLENHLHPTEYKWFAVYTQSRGEKTAFKRLQAKGINVYLPLQKKIRIYGRKKREVEFPLITCYLFVKVTKKEYVKVLETEGVLNYVKFNRNLISIPDAEIDLLRRVLGEGWEVETTETGDWKVGDTVEINQGRLVGTRGTLVSKDGKKLFTVELATLGLGLRMEVDKELLTKI